jgi:hypothetical protein
MMTMECGIIRDGFESTDNDPIYKATFEAALRPNGLYASFRVQLQGISGKVLTRVSTFPGEPKPEYTLVHTTQGDGFFQWKSSLPEDPRITFRGRFWETHGFQLYSEEQYKDGVKQFSSVYGCSPKPKARMPEDSQILECGLIASKPGEKNDLDPIYKAVLMITRDDEGDEGKITNFSVDLRSVFGSEFIRTSTDDRSAQYGSPLIKDGKDALQWIGVWSKSPRVTMEGKFWKDGSQYFYVENQYRDGIKQSESAYGCHYDFPKGE